MQPWQLLQKIGRLKNLLQLHKVTLISFDPSIRRPQFHPTLNHERKKVPKQCFLSRDLMRKPSQQHSLMIACSSITKECGTDPNITLVGKEPETWRKQPSFQSLMCKKVGHVRAGSGLRWAQVRSPVWVQFGSCSFQVRVSLHCQLFI